MALRIPRPRSITALVLLGYAMIMLPLSIALGWTLIQLDSFATRSQSLIVSGVEATQNTRELQEQLSIMERVARQYLVAEDPELAEFLQADSDTIAEVTERLKRFAEDVETRAMLGRIDLAVDELVSALPEGSNAVAGAIGRFIDAGDAARALEVQFQEGIDRQVFALKADAADTRTALIWQAGVLGGLSVFTMIFVTWRVSRPIRVLDRAINQLGEGRFSQRIEVVGPGDLVALGRQLEWLRQRLLELRSWHNFVDKAVVQQVLSRLESLRKLFAHGLLHYAPPCKANRSFRLSEDDVTQHGKARRYATSCRVGQNWHIQQPGRAMPLQRCRNFGHLHQAEHAFLHSRPAR